jgi:hypothetical protein
MAYLSGDFHAAGSSGCDGRQWNFRVPRYSLEVFEWPLLPITSLAVGEQESPSVRVVFFRRGYLSFLAALLTFAELLTIHGHGKVCVGWGNEG